LYRGNDYNVYSTHCLLRLPYGLGVVLWERLQRIQHALSAKAPVRAWGCTTGIPRNSFGFAFVQCGNPAGLGEITCGSPAELTMDYVMSPHVTDFLAHLHTILINQLTNVNSGNFFEFDTIRSTQGHSLKLKVGWLVGWLVFNGTFSTKRLYISCHKRVVC